MHDASFVIFLFSGGPAADYTRAVMAQGRPEMPGTAGKD